MKNIYTLAAIRSVTAALMRRKVTLAPPLIDLEESDND